MKNKKKMVTILLAALLILAFAAPAFAALASKNITVYTGANLYYDDKAFYPTDANGNAVDAFIYNGTTYLPVRAICNLLDVDIAWEGSTQSVYIGKHSSDKPACYLDEMDYFTSAGYSIKRFTSTDYTKDNLGNVHDHVMSRGQSDFTWQLGGSKTYVLNGQYSELSGTFFQQYGHRSSTDTTTFTVYGDGKKLYKTSATTGTYPIDFAIDLTGVLELKIEMDRDYASLGELALWK